VLAIFITVLFAISAYLTMRHLVIPLDIIIEASRRFGDGFTKVEVYYSRRNLLKNLFATFNDMVKKVNFNNRLLEKKVDERTYALQEEINRRKKVERELRMLSRTDSLTGIWNRGYFFELLKRELERCQRYNINMTLIMIDIDLFKNINDTYGHSVGDQAIKHLVALISANTRKENIFARLGGEEFGIILIEAGGADKIQHVVERIRKNVQDNPLIINTQSIPLTISIGMTNISLEDNEHTIYIRADNALYLAKKNGRNRVEEI
ncbi:diguanylate cyclase, partial [bacterium]|nr:diguanylate cyclase [bacterium]